MKHFRILLPLLILALLLTGCAESVREPYNYTQGGFTVIVDPENQTITHGENVYDYTVEKGASRVSYVIHYPNGSTYHWTATKTGGSGGWSDDYDETLYIPGSILVSAVEESIPRQRVGNPGLGLILIGLGTVNFFLPELPFYLRYGWAAENAEPSDAYIIWAKVGGVISAIAGLLACFI